MKLESRIQTALEILFTNTSANGFWNQEQGRIIERLNHDRNWHWTIASSDQLRYGFFTLAELLIATDMLDLNLSRYGDKIVRYIKFIYSHIAKLGLSDLTYGALTSLILGRYLYPELNIHPDKIITLFNNTLAQTTKSIDCQDTLILIAAKYYLKQFEDEKARSNLTLYVNRLLSSQSNKGFFNIGDLRATYHQRIMYTLWGLLFSTSFFDSDRIKIAVENSINYVWKNRRDSKDDAFIWHPSIYSITKNRIKIPIVSMHSKNYLFECHQTFFANAINFYQKFFNSNNFEQEKNRALEWIFGANRLQTNLVDITGIGVPARIMTREGELFVAKNNFKGSYEIGSYILALAAAQKN